MASCLLPVTSCRYALYPLKFCRLGMQLVLSVFVCTEEVW